MDHLKLARECGANIHAGSFERLVTFREDQLAAFVERVSAPEGWIALTDEDRYRAFNRLDGGLNGFIKLWGWLHYAKAIEEMCREKNRPPAPAANQEKNP